MVSLLVSSSRPRITLTITDWGCSVIVQFTGRSIDSEPPTSTPPEPQLARILLRKCDGAVRLQWSDLSTPSSMVVTRYRAATNVELDIRVPDGDGSLNTDLWRSPHSWTDLRGTKSTFWFVHHAATLSFTRNGLMCLPYRQIGRVMKSCKSRRVIHLQNWPTSKFSCVSAASSSICDTCLMRI